MALTQPYGKSIISTKKKHEIFNRIPGAPQEIGVQAALMGLAEVFSLFILPSAIILLSLFIYLSFKEKGE